MLGLSLPLWGTRSHNRPKQRPCRLILVRVLLVLIPVQLLIPPGLFVVECISGHCNTFFGSFGRKGGAVDSSFVQRVWRRPIASCCRADSCLRAIAITKKDPPQCSKGICS